MGLEVRGYRATERDLQDLARRQAAAQRTQEQREDRQERRDDRRHHRDDAAAARHLRVVETVVRARVSDRDRQDAIMATARERVADWLERGARFERSRTDHAAPERQRGR